MTAGQPRVGATGTRGEFRHTPMTSNSDSGIELLRVEIKDSDGIPLDSVPIEIGPDGIETGGELDIGRDSVHETLDETWNALD